ncbi:protein TIFY 5A-like [Mangifera indica]|uniref:protein TIFY 5A-like n=1 Tax=Mangifera indica TaxID=29780 RepID=UPI001CFBF729|nr:protein TIFY 5A-like [Mangifera indica]
MKRNCNLELCLLPPSSTTAALEEEYSGRRHRHHHQNIMDQESSSSPHYINQRPQQLTIFYNGRVCVCDVTEFQARNILLLASREMEERVKTPTGSEPASPSLPSQLYSPPSTSGLSMKRSLQRFLQKRKHRAAATFPYGQ